MFMVEWDGRRRLRLTQIKLVNHSRNNKPETPLFRSSFGSPVSSASFTSPADGRRDVCPDAAVPQTLPPPSNPTPNKQTTSKRWINNWEIWVLFPNTLALASCVGGNIFDGFIKVEL